jgi:receptor-type tyrosine-protein phosphatase Q
MPLQLVVIFAVLFATAQCSTDLTLVAETNGTAVVDACIIKISQSGIFTVNDQQMIRRIAFVETRYGSDPSTYSSATNHGGIWQLSEAKYNATKNTGSNSQLLQQVNGISTSFGINWLTTTWNDLRKPFYSALAARLYLQVITASIPLASLVSSQGTYWSSYYTSSGGTQADFVTGVNQLQLFDNCSVSALDLFFVMDESGSVGYSNYQIMKTFVYNIVNSFDVTPDKVRVGVMSYSSSYTFRFYLNTHSQKSSVLSAISNLPYNSGLTNTAGALTGILNYAFTTANGARPASQGVPRVVIVITDGYSNSFSATISAATSLHNAGIIVFAIGISGANQAELNGIASQPSYVSFISSFNINQLNALQISISQESCVASPDLSIDQTVDDTVTGGEVKYVNYPLPNNNNQGITIVLNVSNGSAVLYASTVVSTPNEAIHDVKIQSDNFEDVYIDPQNLTNPNTADTVYIAIEGQNPTNHIQISASNGDTSTEPATILSTFPSTLSESYGSDFSVTCIASGKPKPTIAWYKNTTLLSSLSNIGITLTHVDNLTISNDLTITSLTQSNSGIYICSATNVLPNGTVTHYQSVTLSVTGIIPINFIGNAVSSTAIYISWSLPIVQGISINHYVLNVNELETNRSWTFHVVETHANVISLHPYYNYICKVAAVENVTHPYTTSITVTTHQAAPTGPPQNIQFSPSSSTTLVLTWQPPSFSQRNGIIVNYIIYQRELETGATSHYNSATNSIIVHPLHPFYSYVYAIRAVTVGAGPYTTEQTVKMPEDAPSSPPMNKSVSVVDSRTINVSWAAPPFSSQNGIIRYYTISLVEVDTNIVTTHSSSGLQYVISNLHPYYFYNVTVRAVTIAAGPTTEGIVVQLPQDAPSGSPQSFAATINSPYSADLSWSPPPLADQNGIITGYIINVTILETNYNFFLFSNTTSLLVDSLRPFRNYVCVIAAITNVGMGPYSTTVTVTTPQDAPSGPPNAVTASTPTSTSFTLYWTQPLYEERNGIVVEYHITVLEQETNIITQHTTTANAFTLSSLHPAYTYSCSIAAYTVGLGPFTAYFNVTTLEEAPTQPPQSFTGISQTSTSLTLSWDPPSPEYQNGLIISYTINVTSLETGTSIQYTTSSMSLTLTGLSPYSTYTCVVAAHTSIGIGPFTTQFTITTLEDAPTSPPTITTHFIIDSSSVAIQWTPPPSDDHNGIIRKYTVYITSVGSNSVTTSRDFTGTSAIIGSLIPSYTYRFTVAAYTVATGPSSPSIMLTLPEDSPSGFPRDLYVNETTPYSISLSWHPPLETEQNGVIIGYIINVTHANTLQTTQYQSLSTSIIITGLEPYTTYVCIVAAETSIGVGPFSHLFFVLTQEAAPDSPPQHPNAIALSPYSIHITWDPPLLQDHNGVIREYQVNVIEHSSNQLIQETTNQTQLIVDGLRPFHTYHCSILAVTVDEGPYTVNVSVVTEEDAPSSSPQSLSVNVINSVSALIWWTPPPIDTHNGIIRSYRVIIYNHRYGTEQIFNTIHTMLNTSVLSPYTSYSIKVAANTVSLGPYTDLYNVTTPEDVPTSPPESFNATSGDSTTLYLQWEVPDSSGANGIIREYNVTIIEEETGLVLQLVTSSLFIHVSNLHPFYTYRCTVAAVTIGLGPEAVFYIQMPEDAPSSSPAGIVSTSTTSTSIDIKWGSLPFEHQNGLVRYYIINITETNSGLHYQTQSSTESITLNGLHPYYIYHISIAAYTVSLGPFSNVQIFITDEDVPTSSPASITSKTLNANSVQLQWLPPSLDTQNGIIIGYNLTIEKSSNVGPSIQFLTSSTNYTVSNLEAYTIYQWRVAAYTSVGIGPYTDLSFFQTHEAAPSQSPEMLMAVDVSSTTMTLSWGPPPIDSHNGIVRSYIVSVFNNRTGSLTYHNASDSTIVINELLPYSFYHVSIAALTIGIGPYTTPLVVRTDEAAPSSSPTSLTLTAIDPVSVNITWSPPPIDMTNGIIQHYLINISTMETLEVHQYHSVTTYLTLDSLHPYYTYTVYIAAVTVDVGPYSAAHTITTPQSVPSGPPQSLTVTILTSTSLQIDWEHILQSEQNGIITSYTVTIADLTTNTTFGMWNNLTDIYLYINNLHPFYNYKVSVSGSTIIGTGPSTSVVVQTFQDVPSGVPQNVQYVMLNSSAVIVSWDPPPVNQHNGIISQYIVNLRNYETGTITTINATGTNVTLVNLQPFYQYEVGIFAVTIGAGPSSLVSFQMPQDAPSGAPTNINVTAVNSSIIYISWDPPDSSETNGIITKYIIHITNENSMDSRDVINSTELTITGLKPYNIYSISIAAYTIGIGPFNTPSITIQLPESVPSLPPSEFIAVLENNATLRLSWQPPSGDSINGPLLGYQLHCHAQNGHSLVTQEQSNTALLRDIHNNTYYTCEVCAYTSAGCGPSTITYISTYATSTVGPPYLLTAGKVTETTIHVQWMSPIDPYSVILSYSVVYQLVSTSFSTITTPRLPITITDVNITSYTLQSLLMSSTYKVTVYPVLQEGNGLPSESIFVTTKAATYSSPDNFHCDVLSSSGLLCRWDPPFLLDHEVLYYQISYRLADGFDYYSDYGEVLDTDILSPETRQYPINNLLPYAGYQVELTVTLSPILASGSGSGSSSTGNVVTSSPDNYIKGTTVAINITHPEVPSASVEDVSMQIQSPKSVYITWKPPPKSEWKGKIESYIIAASNPLQSLSATVGTLVNNPDPSVAIEPLQFEEYTFNGLEENFEYSISIAIVTGAGTGVYSSPFIEKMPQTAPTGPPVNISLANVGLTYVNITWSPPSEFDANGIITGYTAVFRRIEIEESTEYNIPANTTYFLKYGLYQYESIGFQISAKTVVGQGPFSREIIFNTNDGVPNPPTSITTEIINETSVLLTWKPPATAKADVTEYQIFYSGFGRSTVKH